MTPIVKTIVDRWWRKDHEKRKRKKLWMKQWRKLHAKELRAYQTAWARHERNPEKYPRPEKCITPLDPNRPVPIKKIKPGHCHSCDILLKFGGSGTDKYCEDCANERGII